MLRINSCRNNIIYYFYGPKVVHPIDSTQSPLNVLRMILDTVAHIQW